MEGDSGNGNEGVRRRSVREKKSKTMSLDEYVDFFVSHKSLDLTVNFLNQIILMHGFRKLHKLPKKIVTAAVNTLDLVNPSRSTLSEKSISSAATLTLEDVIADLENLKWQECCVTSLQVHNVQKENPPAAASAAASAQIAPPASVALAAVKPNKMKKSRKKKLLDLVEPGGSGTCEATKNPPPLPKKKKKRNAAAEATGGGDGVSVGMGYSETAASSLSLHG